MVDLDRLEKAILLRGLTRDQMARLQPIFEERVYEKGAIIFRERQEAGKLCFLDSGLVDLRLDQSPRQAANRSTLTTVEPGFSFGWSALVEPHRYTLTSYCVSESCKVIMADREDLLGLFRRDREIGFVVMTNLAQVIADRFQVLQEEMARREGFDIRVQW